MPPPLSPAMLLDYERQSGCQILLRYTTAGWSRVDLNKIMNECMRSKQGWLGGADRPIGWREQAGVGLEGVE